MPSCQEWLVICVPVTRPECPKSGSLQLDFRCCFWRWWWRLDQELPGNLSNTPLIGACLSVCENLQPCLLICLFMLRNVGIDINIKTKNIFLKLILMMKSWPAPCQFIQHPLIGACLSVSPPVCENLQPSWPQMIFVSFSVKFVCLWGCALGWSTVISTLKSWGTHWISGP